MAFADSENEYRHGDTDNNILRKILRRLFSIAGLVENITPTVVLEPGDIEIGAVELKDGTSDTRAKVATADPGAADPGIVVRNIPSGEQAVYNIHDIANPLFDASFHGHLHTGVEKTAYVFHVLGRRAGFNSTAVLQDVAEFLGLTTDAMPELTGAESLEIVSSSASDALAGTGAQKVRVGYINGSNALVISPDIPMNGTTPVATGFAAKFILWMEVTQVGTNSVSAGTIILRVAGPGATHEQITVGGNKSMSCRFMVPAGYSAYVESWHAAAVGVATQDVRLRATVKTGDRALGTVYLFQDNGFLAAGSQMDAALPWLKFPALSRIKVSTVSSAVAVGNRVDSDITLLLVQD